MNTIQTLMAIAILISGCSVQVKKNRHAQEPPEVKLVAPPKDFHLILGDTNEDGCVDLLDRRVVELFFEQEIKSTTIQEAYSFGDFNFDGKVDDRDLEMLTTNLGHGCLTQRIPGDVDGDGCVTVLDYSILSNNFDLDTSMINYEGRWRSGDLNLNGQVDLFDYSEISDHFDECL